MSWTFEATKKGYANLWAAMDIRPEKEAAIENAAKRILAGKARYLAVEAKTGVPWFFVGCLHDMEAACRFDCHLHNGDPLTARTVQVPKGRPITGKPPFAWEVSAIDALTMHGLQKIAVWSIERILYEAERYNGLGYTTRGINSPYDWAGSDNYDRGKFVSDGVFSSTAVSQQLGVGPLLSKLSALDATVRLYSEVNVLPMPQVVKQSHGIRWLLVTATAYVGNMFHDTVSNVASFTTGFDFSDVQENVRQSVSTGQEIASWFGYEAKAVVPYLVAVGLLMTFYHFWRSERIN